MYQKVVDAFGLKKGDIIYLSSDLVKLADHIRRKEGRRFDPVKLLEMFQQAVGEQGTIMLPTFCFGFSNDGYYDYAHTKGTSGALGNIALFKCGYMRTRHPMHSFAVRGKDSDMLVNMENKHSFGEDSPFGYCKVNNVKQIMLGTDYRHAMTFVHYVETVCNVPYRFAKVFTGKYIDSYGKETEREYDYAVRRLDVGTKEKFNRIGEILEEKGAAHKIMMEGMNGCVSYIAMLGDSFPIIKSDITENMCRNLYDFRVSREELFKRYTGI